MAGVESSELVAQDGDTWIKVEVYGLLRQGEALNVSDLSASLGLERVALVTAHRLEPVPGQLTQQPDAEDPSVSPIRRDPNRT